MTGLGLQVCGFMGLWSCGFAFSRGVNPDTCEPAKQSTSHDARPAQVVYPTLN